MKKAKKRKDLRKIDSILNLPVEAVSTIHKITIIGFNEILIENYKGIMEYEDFFVRVATFTGIIDINGYNLSLTEMKEDAIMIKGKIDSLDFENDVEDV